MLVAAVMTRDVKSCVATDSLDRPAHLMLAHDAGCVPVVDGEGRAIGLITDRDLCMSAFISGRPLHELGVERTMTGAVHTCREDDTLDQAHATMQAHAVRRLVVVDGEGRLAGLLSLADLVQATPFLVSAPARKRSQEQVLDTLQAVTCPRETDLAVRFADVSAKPGPKARKSRAKSAVPTERQGELLLGTPAPTPAEPQSKPRAPAQAKAPKAKAAKAAKAPKAKAKAKVKAKVKPKAKPKAAKAKTKTAKPKAKTTKRTAAKRPGHKVSGRVTRRTIRAPKGAGRAASARG